jgi:hypothetical protein
MNMSECIKVLKKNTPNCFLYDWMINRSQMMVCSLYLDGMSVSVDVSEIKSKTDDEIKKLINNRIIDVLRETIIKIDPNYFASKNQS